MVQIVKTCLYHSPGNVVINEMVFWDNWSTSTKAWLTGTDMLLHNTNLQKRIQQLSHTTGIWYLHPVLHLCLIAAIDKDAFSCSVSTWFEFLQALKKNAVYGWGWLDFQWNNICCLLDYQIYLISITVSVECKPRAVLTIVEKELHDFSNYHVFKKHTS